MFSTAEPGGCRIYNIYQSNITEYTDLDFSFLGFNYIPGETGTRDLCMTYSDYSRLRDMLGYDPVTMDNSQFLIHCLPHVYPDIASHSKNNFVLGINGHNLNLSGIYTENFDQYDGFSNGRFFILVIPDFVASDMDILFAKYSVITNGIVTYYQYKMLLNEFDTLKPFRFNIHDNYSPGAWQTEFLDAKAAIQKSNGILYTTGALPMWYIAFILCIAGVAILVADILSEEAKYKQQFTLLRNIGYSSRKLDNIILIQLLFFSLCRQSPH